MKLKKKKLQPKKNKRHMGHISHLRNQLKLIYTFEQSYDHIIKLIGRKNLIISFRRIEWSLFVIGPVAPEKKIFQLG